MVGRLVDWLVGQFTAVTVIHRQPPPADLRVSSGNVIAAFPASFWWPSKAETETREEGFKTKEAPNKPKKEPLKS